MFRCDKCKKVTEPREPRTLRVTQKRQKTYENATKVSHGWEIVKEEAVCRSCALELGLTVK